MNDKAASIAVRLLPPTRRRSVLAVVIVLAALCLALAMLYATGLPKRPSIAGALAAAFWTFLAVGLWTLNRAARAIAMVILFLAIPISILGVINPFMMMDIRHATGREPSVWRLVAVVAPIVAFAVACLHILGTHKAEFGRRGERRDSGAAEPPSPGQP